MENSDTEKKIMELQMMEQNMQNFAIQKQRFQAALTEIDNALDEIKKTKDSPYKIIGNIMINVKKEDLEKDLKEKKNVLEIRLKNIEKQEVSIKEKSKEAQQEIMKKLNKK
ncbi:MAG: prefoldin subunit beta [Candidatus Nanoarchaeia archaeon]|nr:prefoldin subunit beta [Candidatus Nanoarchaeia archaeon]MDD5587948.1 prefoldin subunit beta [Candidatus Nanoarchaeia archaeon]